MTFTLHNRFSYGSVYLWVHEGNQGYTEYTSETETGRDLYPPGYMETEEQRVGMWSRREIVDDYMRRLKVSAF
ncbi:hypothetical protein VTO73DRAFT_9242 [Trametes versicolor]